MKRLTFSSPLGRRKYVKVSLLQTLNKFWQRHLLCTDSSSGRWEIQRLGRFWLLQRDEGHGNQPRHAEGPRPGRHHRLQTQLVKGPGDFRSGGIRYFNSISSFCVYFLRLHTNWRSCPKVTRRKSMKLRKSSTPSENWFGSQAPMLWDCIYMTRV